MKCVCESRSVVSNSLWPRGLYDPWNSPGQNTGVGSLSLFQGIFWTQGSNPGLPHCRQFLYQLSHREACLMIRFFNSVLYSFCFYATAEGEKSWILSLDNTLFFQVCLLLDLNINIRKPWEVLCLSKLLTSVLPKPEHRLVVSSMLKRPGLYQGSEVQFRKNGFLL